MKGKLATRALIVLLNISSLNCQIKRQNASQNRDATTEFQRVAKSVDASIEKPNDSGLKLEAKPRKNNLEWERQKGIPYRKSEAEKRLEKLEQSQ